MTDGRDDIDMNKLRYAIEMELQKHMPSPIMTDIDVDALAPCPFCGETSDEADGAAVSLYRACEAADWFVFCHGCGAEMPERESKAAAIAAWNTRAQSAPAPDREAVARAIAAELGNQGIGIPLSLGADLHLPWLDQGETDLGAVADAAIAAYRATN